jgi:hypothetical protein
MKNEALLSRKLAEGLAADLAVTVPRSASIVCKRCRLTSRRPLTWALCGDHESDRDSAVAAAKRFFASEAHGENACEVDDVDVRWNKQGSAKPGKIATVETALLVSKGMGSEVFDFSVWAPLEQDGSSHEILMTRLVSLGAALFTELFLTFTDTGKLKTSPVSWTARTQRMAALAALCATDPTLFAAAKCILDFRSMRPLPARASRDLDSWMLGAVDQEVLWIGFSNWMQNSSGSAWAPRHVRETFFVEIDGP